MDVMVVIERVGYDIRTPLENVDSSLSNEALVKMGKVKFKELGVEVREDDFFDLYEF